MYATQAWTNHRVVAGIGTGTGINRRQAISLALVLLAHIVFWQVLRMQYASRFVDHGNSAVHYLQVLNIQPKTVPKPSAAIPVAVAVTVKPAVITRRSPPDKQKLPATQQQNLGIETTPEAITPPTTTDALANSDKDNTAGLDLDAMRRSAVLIDRKRKLTEIEKIQISDSRQATLEQRLGEGTRRAEKKECMKAFSGLGLLAVIPLAVSTVVDTGCKW